MIATSQVSPRLISPDSRLFPRPRQTPQTARQLATYCMSPFQFRTARDLARKSQGRICNGRSLTESSRPRMYARSVQIIPHHLVVRSWSFKFCYGQKCQKHKMCWIDLSRVCFSMASLALCANPARVRCKMMKALPLCRRYEARFRVQPHRESGSVLLRTVSVLRHAPCRLTKNY